mmetsp:Transcript_1607/g.3082  ORF Transcript_1607/g.3082 Transcript_1607/m.3082 type:complete len:557 (-) Transcript_1607:1076-2746(-)
MAVATGTAAAPYQVMDDDDGEGDNRSNSDNINNLDDDASRSSSPSISQQQQQQQSPSLQQQSSPPSVPTAAPFWILGLLNNASFVIMIASAKSISEGGTALVYISSVLPGLFVKLSAPYWFDRVSYRYRLGIGSALMAGCFALVGIFSRPGGSSVVMQLLGVALCSLQGSMGEASLLALAGKYDTSLESSLGSHEGGIHGNDGQTKKKGKCITAFSSGTGIAGVFGFAYKVFLTQVLGLSLQLTLFLAIGFAVLYWWTYWAFLDSHINAEAAAAAGAQAQEEIYDEEGSLLSTTSGRRIRDIDGRGSGVELPTHDAAAILSTTGSRKQKRRRRKGYDGVHTSASEGGIDEWEDEFDVAVASHDSDDGPDIPSLTAVQRLKLSLTFWPYMIPLFTVYAAEYALQAGTWTAIGFPVDSVQARDQFYEYSNWVYQVGVFISRSSGTVYQASMLVFWLMPILQCINLALFSYIAATHVWYDYSLLILCFYVGLLGGGVYVNGYLRINADLPKSIREFALSTVSVADTFGIIFADFVGLFIQSCLYQKNGIDGAVAHCPLS